jgi:hypothetical protein
LISEVIFPLELHDGVLQSKLIIFSFYIYPFFLILQKDLTCIHELVVFFFCQKHFCFFFITSFHVIFEIFIKILIHIIILEGSPDLLFPLISFVSLICLICLIGLISLISLLSLPSMWNSWSSRISRWTISLFSRVRSIS